MTISASVPIDFESPGNKQYQGILYRCTFRHLFKIGLGGIYAIDDMLPQPNWLKGHAKKAQKLIDALEQRSYLRILKMSWASGIILAIECLTYQSILW